MRTRACGLIVFALATVTAPAGVRVAAEDPGGWQELFDREGLDGWQYIGPAESFCVENGA